ncbi:MAG: hypothetical protein WCF59_09925 [Desulfobaccales bacterium]
MSMLLFMPWCAIDKDYNVGDIDILPFDRRGNINGLDDDAQRSSKTIMATYKDLKGRPIQKACIIHYAGKSLIDDLTNDEIEIAQDLAVIACFAGLANREFFNSLGLYCNSDCFSLYIQKFEKTDFIALMIRRREGRTMSVWPIDDLTITIPIHCNSIREVVLDAGLLKALVDHRSQLKNGEWGKWQNAISCFNQANTDSDNIRYQMEWVLLCSAFEHILGADSKAKDVASKLAGAFVPSEEFMATDAIRLSEQQKNDGKSVRYEWMREFYRIRGDFAHGKLTTEQPATWNPLEHLFLATIAFPLLVKSLLNKAGKYKLTDSEQAQIDSFEKFADTPDFLQPPPNQKSSMDSHWIRLRAESSRKIRKIAVERALMQPGEIFAPDQRQCPEESSDEENR